MDFWFSQEVKCFETQMSLLQSSGFNLPLGPWTALEIQKNYFEQDKLLDNVAITFLWQV